MGLRHSRSSHPIQPEHKVDAWSTWGNPHNFPLKHVEKKKHGTIHMQNFEAPTCNEWISVFHKLMVACILSCCSCPLIPPRTRGSCGNSLLPTKGQQLFQHLFPLDGSCLFKLRPRCYFASLATSIMGMSKTKRFLLLSNRSQVSSWYSFNAMGMMQRPRRSMDK